MTNDLIATGPTSGLQYVRITAAMADKLEALELQAFPTAKPEDLYDAAGFIEVADEFPEGSFIGFDGDDRIDPVAIGLGIRTDFDFDNPQHNMKAFIADAPTLSGDNPEGDWYYGTDLSLIHISEPTRPY